MRGNVDGAAKRKKKKSNELEINIAVPVRWLFSLPVTSPCVAFVPVSNSRSRHRVRCTCVCLSVSVPACEPRLDSVHFCTRWLITARVCLLVEGGRSEWRGMSTFLVYDKVTENHWGGQVPPPPPQPSSAPKTPAAVQKVRGVGCLPFNETIKGPVSPSIDLSHSFSDKFELIIQHQAPGDVYFQHEGQLIHSVSFPPL